MAISQIEIPIYDKLREEILNSETQNNLILATLSGHHRPRWSSTDGLMLYKKRVHVPQSAPLFPERLHALHDATHEGVEKTLHVPTPTDIPRL